MESNSSGDWQQMIEEANLESDFPIKLKSGPAPEAYDGAQNLLVRELRRAIFLRNPQLEEDKIFVDGQRQIWMPLERSGSDMWLTVQTAQVLPAQLGYIFAISFGLFSALLGGIALFQLVSKPLRALENHLGEFSSPVLAPKLDETGPLEVAAVSRSINDMTARLRQGEADRALLLAGVSHDLRTPLTKLRLSMALFKGVETELLDGAVAQINRIELMLGQFLEYARGFEAEEKRSFSLSSLVQDAADNTALDGEIEIRIHDDIIVEAKQTALTRAVGNLIKNATAYGEAPIVATTGGLGGHVYIDVIDSGTGMTDEEVTSLLRPFARGSKARSGNGTGLGLAITEEAARANGGTLEFKQLKEGFRARISIPA
ncbi:MAG: ATP-binding protein [Pseudomonadota bacterium]